MSGATADAPPGGGDRDPLFDEVVSRLPLAAGPEQMERLVLLALRMLLRRDEDREQLDRLTRSVHEAIAQARQKLGDHDLHPVGQECAKLLEAAWRSQQSRQVVLHPAERARSERRAPRVPLGRQLAAAMMILTAVLLFLPAAAIAIDPSLAPASWRSPPIVRLTAAQLAQEIVDLPAGDASELAGRGIVTHLARLIDDRPLVMADNLPRRLCPKTALLLAQRGEVTIFGYPAPDARASTLASLCHRENGDVRLMWSPNRN